MHTTTWVAVFTTAIVLSACKTAAQPEPQSDPITTTALESKSSMETTKPNNDRATQLAHAREDLAQRLNINDSDIGVLSTRSVTWRSGALGCPKDGMMYTQALVPGRLFVLRVGQKTYRYHADEHGLPFYCPNERVESPGTDSSDM